MTDFVPLTRPQISRWVRIIIVMFLLLGLSFGSWLSRLPAVRDALGASAIEMSIYGLCLALGSLVGLTLSGHIVSRYGPRNVLIAGVSVMAFALPGAAAIILNVSIPVGLVVLFTYGFAFSIADVAANVSGANAESLFGKPRLPLMHAGYSLGAVASTGLGAVAEAFGVPVPLHLGVVTVLSAVIIIPMLLALPRDEQVARLAGEHDTTGLTHDTSHGPGHRESALEPTTGAIPVIDSAAGQQPAFTTMTGAIPIITPEHTHAHGGAAGDDAPTGAESQGSEESLARPYSPWRDPRILLLGLTALAFGLIEGTAADWLPLALVDGRGLSNQLGSILLSVFFAAVLAVRLVGSPILLRFGRTGIVRVSALIALVGVVAAIVVPGTAGIVIGVIAWGLGTGLGWPIAISAAADNPTTAARDVGAVSALGYGAMLVGPMAFGFLGEHIGLLTAFWALVPFAVLVCFTARALNPQQSR